MNVKKLTDVDVRGKRVFIRADLNVPQDDAGNITEDTRIRASIPSIQHCLLGERNLLRHEVASSARTESFTRGVGASDRSLVDRNNVDQGQERAASDPKRT